MTQNLEQLSKHEQVLDSIRGIVRTMKTLAAINAAPYERAAVAIDAYHRTIRSGLSAYAYRVGTQHQMADTTIQRRIVVAFGSDHGFCGNYNELVARAVQRHQKNCPDARPTILCVGAKLQNALLDHKIEVGQRLTPPASVDGLGRLAGQIVTRIEQFSRTETLTSIAVDLAYTRRAAQASREPVVRPLLPIDDALLKAPRRWSSRSLPDFSMPANQLLSALLRNHLFASVFRASAEAMVTENAARLAIMQQAEQTVDERLETVRRQISSSRQDAITQELMDIIIGHDVVT